MDAIENLVNKIITKYGEKNGGYADGDACNGIAFCISELLSIGLLKNIK